MDYQKEAHNSLVTLYQDKARECDRLEEELKQLKNKSRGMTEELKLYKALANDGAIYVNSWSIDCDGVESYSSSVYNSIDEYYQGEEDFAESIEGSCSWKIVTPEDARPQEECGSYGQGWDIN